MIAQPTVAAPSPQPLVEPLPLHALARMVGPPDPERPHRARLIGRERELAVLTSLVDRAPMTGAALLIRGAPGAGKSALIGALVAELQDRPAAILRASGIRAEANLPYAGLHQLLRPVLGELGSLPRHQRRALEAAFGHVVSSQPDPFLIAVATLDLLSMVAGSSLVVVVEDAQWLDRRTSDLLSFVARRVSSDRIVLLVTARDDRGSPILDAGLAELHLEGLGDDEARRVLASVAPGIAEPVRERLVAVAAGNPLALVELPAGLTSEQRAGRAPLADAIPLSARLERSVTGRIRGLPVVTRRLLRLLALDDGGDLAELLDAYGTLHPDKPAARDDLLPAVAAGFLVVHGQTAMFRDPLIRAAVHQCIGGVGRRTARAPRSAARAEAGPATPPVVASPTGPNEEVNGVGVVPLDDVGRARLQLLREPGVAEIADGVVTSDLVRLAQAALDDGDELLARRLLWTAAQRARWGIGDDESANVVGSVAERMGPPGDDPWLLAISAAVRSADAVAICDAAARYDRPDATPTDLLLAGMASAIAGDAVRSRSLLSRASPALRSEGDRIRLAPLLVMQAWNDIHVGRWTEAASEIEAGAELARETGQAMWSVVADIGDALLGAMRGNEDQVERALARVGPAAIGRGDGWVASTVEVVRGINELSTGRPELAFARLQERVGSSAPDARWAVDYFADAAVLSGRVDEGRATLQASASRVDVGRGPLDAAAHRYADAVLADDGTADEGQGAAIDDLAGWPIHQARLQLHRGRWLRRRRRVADSRVPLRAARDLFEAIGAAPLAERARRELRASGERIRRHEITEWDQLSPQETEIAHLAAEGLSNREIGDQLFLSHRTVGAHLYRIFPKLGVTSRGQLHRVLATTDPDLGVEVRSHV